MAEEYYDFERETRRRASLAEESLNEQLVGMVRAVSRSVSLLREVTEALASGDPEKLRRLHTEIKKVKERTESMKEDALSYLARLGDLLDTGSLYRSVFLRLTRVAQVSEGLAYRAYLAAANTTISSKTVLELMSRLIDTVIREFEKLESAAQNLTSKPKSSYEEAQVILSIEDEADDLYRQLSFTLYKELHNDIVGLMLIRDISDMAEDIADLIRDASEDVKFLALRRVQQGY
ncbi:MAG: DUF47 family protein [Crenarchaeota archaeon]|nr:DUF47 family protein [Thermoproteota archaeon]